MKAKDWALVVVALAVLAVLGQQAAADFAAAPGIEKAGGSGTHMRQGTFASPRVLPAMGNNSGNPVMIGSIGTDAPVPPTTEPELAAPLARDFAAVPN